MFVFWENFIESFYDFFGRRKPKGLLDEMTEKLAPIFGILSTRPEFEDSIAMHIDGKRYDIKFLASDGLNPERYPSIMIVEIVSNIVTRRYSIESELIVSWKDEGKIEIEFIRNFPIEVVSIRTRNKLEYKFGWTRRHLDAFYKKAAMHAVEIV